MAKCNIHVLGANIKMPTGERVNPEASYKQNMKQNVLHEVQKVLQSGYSQQG